VILSGGITAGCAGKSWARVDSLATPVVVLGRHTDTIE
jgi:hypothetical protein